MKKIGIYIDNYKLGMFKRELELTNQQYRFMYLMINLRMLKRK